MQDSPEFRELITSMFVEQGRRQKAEKLERYRRLNQFVKPGQILFVGSSLMEQFPIGELTMDISLPYVIYNRGVGGFTTAELAQVLDICIYDLKPAHIFINIGTNDLNGADYTLDGLIGRYESILNETKAHLPETKLHLMAYYPVNEAVGMKDSFMGEIFKYRTNQRIREANEAVKALAERMGGTFHDFNAGLTDTDGNLKEEITIEGMHMYADGYRIVLQNMIPFLETISPT